MKKVIMKFTKESMEVSYHCGRCKWIWKSKKYPPEKGIMPKRCPHCNSPYWNKPRTRKRREKIKRMSDEDFAARCMAIESVLPAVNRKLQREQAREREENKA